MPYISSTQREWMDAKISELSDAIHTDGELNYAVTRLALSLIYKQGLKYSVLSSVIGTLHLIPVEISRRVVAPYENLKMGEHGDVCEYHILENQIHNLEPK